MNRHDYRFAAVFEIIKQRMQSACNRPLADHDVAELSDSRTATDGPSAADQHGCLDGGILFEAFDRFANSLRDSQAESIHRRVIDRDYTDRVVPRSLHLV